jgi:hypothetical protein
MINTSLRELFGSLQNKTIDFQKLSQSFVSHTSFEQINNLPKEREELLGNASEDAFCFQIEAKTQEKADEFVRQTLNSRFIAADGSNGSKCLALIDEYQKAGKLNELNEAIKQASGGQNLSDIINNGEFNEADVERLNDALNGTKTFGTSSKFTYFSNGVQNWLTGFIRGISNPGEILKHPLETTALGATVIGMGIACIGFPPLGAALALGGLSVAAWRFASNAFKALTKTDKVEAANAALEAGSGLVDTITSVPGTGQALKEVKNMPQALNNLKNLPDFLKLDALKAFLKNLRKQKISTNTN